MSQDENPEVTPADEPARPRPRRRTRGMTYRRLSEIFAVECSRHLALELERRTRARSQRPANGADAFHGMMQDQELRPELTPYCPTEEEEADRYAPPIALLVDGVGTSSRRIFAKHTAEEFKALVAEVFGNDAAGLPDEEAMLAHRPALILSLYIQGPSIWMLKPYYRARIDAWGTAPTPWSPTVIPPENMGWARDRN